jgi:omega-amidase
VDIEGKKLYLIHLVSSVTANWAFVSLVKFFHVNPYISQMSNSLNITLVQTNLHWEDKAANLSMLENKIRAIQENTQVVVLPEMFTTGFSMNPAKLAETMDGEAVAWMKKMAAERKIILTGSLIINDPISPGGDPRYYNRIVWMLPNGQYGVYDKRHRFALAGEDEEYTAGTKRMIASVNGWKLNLQICYDLRFPIWSRQQIDHSANEPRPEYDVLIYVANWPERRAHAWRTLLQARAIENQCYVIGVNRIGDDGSNLHYSGDSMVVGPLGEVLYQKKEEEDVVTVSLDKSHLQSTREKLPFWKDADEFLIEP